MFLVVNKQQRLWGLSFHFLTCSLPELAKITLERRALLYRMDKNGFLEKFRCKERAESRTEKARGGFSSNKVSKLVIFLNWSYILGDVPVVHCENNNISSRNLSIGLLQRELSK